MEIWLEKQLASGELDFKGLERAAWLALMEIFREAMTEILALLDKILLANRDRDRYVCKERNERTLETMVGGLTIKRRYYWDRQEHRWVHLLDESLGLKPDDRVSPGLAELVVVWATKGPSYRDVRDRLKDLFGAQMLSHEGIRRVLLEVSEAIDRQDANEVLADRPERDKRVVPALFIETDGMRWYKQRPDGRRRGKPEAKLVVIHEGWQRRQGRGKKTDYHLVNPTFIAKNEAVGPFWEYVRGRIDAKYRDMDKIPVVINGDEASWIRRGATHFGRGMYQYDRFHLFQHLRELLCDDPSRLRKAREAAASNNIDGLKQEIVEAGRLTTDPKQFTRLASLYHLMVEAPEAFRDYRVRLKEQGFPVLETWRGLGAAESNVNRFKNRTEKRGRAWSVEGIGGMLTCLSKLHEGTLPDYVTRHIAPAKEWALDKLQTGAGFIARQVQTPGTGVRRGRFPAAGHSHGFGPLWHRLSRI